MYCKYGPKGNSECSGEKEYCNKCQTRLKMIVRKAKELGELHDHVEQLVNELNSLKATTQLLLDKWAPENLAVARQSETMSLKELFDKEMLQAKADAFDALRDENKI